MIEWDTILEWVQTWIDMVNLAFDNAIKTLSVSPFDSSITIINTAMTAVEGVALVLVSMFFAIQLCNDATFLIRVAGFPGALERLYVFVQAQNRHSKFGATHQITF